MTSLSDRGVGHHDTRPLIDHVAADWGNALWLLGRLLIGGIFVQSGLGKLMDLGGFAAMLAAGGVPMSSVLAPIGAMVEFAGGLAIVLIAHFAKNVAIIGAFLVVFVTGGGHYSLERWWRKR